MRDELTRRRGAVPYAFPASRKGRSAYSRETYKGSELDYRGREPQAEKEKPCDQLSSQQPSRG